MSVDLAKVVGHQTEDVPVRVAALSHLSVLIDARTGGLEQARPPALRRWHRRQEG